MEFSYHDFNVRILPCALLAPFHPLKNKFHYFYLGDKVAGKLQQKKVSETCQKRVSIFQPKQFVCGTSIQKELASLRQSFRLF